MVAFKAMWLRCARLAVACALAAADDPPSFVGELKVFTTAECPPGWSEASATKGYVLVGRPEGASSGSNGLAHIIRDSCFPSSSCMQRIMRSDGLEFSLQVAKRQLLAFGAATMSLWAAFIWK